MRTILISVVVIMWGSISSAQDWFPLEVGNVWQYIQCWSSSSISSPTTYSHSIEYKSVDSDTLISEHRYFKGLYSSLFPYVTNLTRYDSLNMKIFVRCDTVENLHMNFNLPPDTSISGILSSPHMCWLEDEVHLFSSMVSFANTQISLRLVQWLEFGWIDREYTIRYSKGFRIFERKRAGVRLGHSVMQLKQG